MTQRISVTVDGFIHELNVSPSQTLLEVLREQLHLTGTKEGCGEGECGACTVLMDSKPVNSCLILAIETDGANIQTIEDLSENGTMHPLQEAFIDNGSVQCGFCTPGFIMTAKALLEKNPQPTVEEIKHAITGNICRCTGYKQIIDGIQDAANRVRRQSG